MAEVDSQIIYRTGGAHRTLLLDSNGSAPVVGQQGENHMGAVGGHTVIIQSTIGGLSTVAYTAGDGIGGLITLTNAMRVSGGSGVLQSLLIIDQDAQKPALDVYIFNSSPTTANGSTYTDNAAFGLGASDLTKLLRRVAVSAADWTTGTGAIAIADISALAKPVVASGAKNLIMALVTTGTPTYTTGTNRLIVNSGFLQD